MSTESSVAKSRGFFLGSYEESRKSDTSDFPTFMTQQLKNIGKVCGIIYANGGKIFGGMVRDYIVGRLEFGKEYSGGKKVFLPSEKVDFRDIDVWVVNERQRDGIVKDLWGQGLIRGEEIMGRNSSIKEHEYFEWSRYQVVFENSSSVGLDIVIGKSFPTNDFSVNLLSYDGVNLRVEDGISYEGKEVDTKWSLGGILRHLKEGKAVVLVDYLSVVSDKAGLEGSREKRKGVFGEKFKLMEL